jgi:hypothetical protein
MNSPLKLFIPALLLFSLSAFAQSDSSSVKQDANPGKPLSDRIFIGGNAALSFGDITFVGVSPIVGYKVTDKWMVGVGGSYYYFRDNFYNYSTSIYGGLLMSRYIVYKGLFLEGDFEENNQDAITVTDPINGIYSLDRKWIPSLLLGGGYSQEIGGRSSFFISILYDVIQNPNSQYYRIPVIRAGVGFGL